MSFRHQAIICFVAQLLVLQLNVANASDDSSFKTLKGQLVDALSSGAIDAANYDKDSELNIADLEMQSAQAYLKRGDRKNALAFALIARRTLQRVYSNPYDPSLIPVYSLLVQVYESAYDKDEPNVNKADAAHAKLYRQMIDHIHSL